MWKILVLMLLLSPGICYAVEGFQVEEVTAFVSPDSSYSELEKLIGSTRNSLYINIYTVTNQDVAELLADTGARGVDVVLMLEKSPVGGIHEEEEAILAYLMKKGLSICLHSTKEVRFNHAKYIVSDNLSTLVTTENLGTTGFPKYNSYGGRGWGIVIKDEELSRAFVELFVSDLRDCTLPSVEASELSQGARKGAYRPIHLAKDYAGSFHVELFTAPEEGVEPILQLLNSANKSVLIEQAYIYTYWGSKREDTVETAPNLFLEAAIDAARRGVKVKILLDSTWYNVEEEDPVSNLHTVNYVNKIAREEGLDLEAKLIDLDAAGLRKLHAKGVVVDNKAVLVSSINWNEHSPSKNREVGVIIYGEPAEYYAEVFECDWVPETCRPEEKWWILALGLFLILLLLIAIVYVAKRKTPRVTGV